MVFYFLFCFVVEGLFNLNFPNWASYIIPLHPTCLELPAESICLYVLGSYMEYLFLGPGNWGTGV